MKKHLSPEDFIIAEQNGIPYERAFQRVYYLHWTIERAINEPVGGWWNQYKDIAVIGKSGFNRRVKKGMDPKKAALTPSRKKQSY